MPKYNVDEQKQLAEPIEITLEGKDYKVGKVTTELLNKVNTLREAGVDAAAKQLAVLVDVDEKEFAGVDIRKVGNALAYITDSIQKSIAAPKNS